jgi:ABC-2 type transport system ATP-binding protein
LLAIVPARVRRAALGYDPAPVADEVITVRGLRKRYGQHEAVKGIDLDVRRGEVSVLGVDPAHPTRAWRERIGLVLQESELDPVYTVRETVEMFARYFSHPRDVDGTVTLVGLHESSAKRVGSLSGGQKRRVDVALGLIGNPELLFLDEPTTGFDPQARRDAWNMIHGLRDLGTTVVLTTHYMEEAQHLADRLLILRDGVVVGRGTRRTRRQRGKRRNRRAFPRDRSCHRRGRAGSGRHPTGADG